ncbi:hypothetical protein ACI3LY_004894 [Candidozyma auris]|nr:hypothetical protein QG37_06150 [[Candida] auris]PSK77754.1 hypothetical protein CJJ07_002408 [[Candida] auris]
MAPPTVVLSRTEVQQRYKEQLQNPEKYQCHLKSLTQNECTFKMSDAGMEYICVPFKRMFQRCLIPETKTVGGKKQRGERWVNIEITNATTNERRRESHQSEIERFLAAEKESYKWYETQEG